MRVLVCGSRHFNDYYKLCNEMDSLNLDEHQPITIIEGGARGADSCARRYAEECGWELEEYPADWKTYGRRAGYVRNTEMLEKGQPDRIIAFWDGKSPGTKMMINLAEKAGIPVKVIEI